MAVRTTTSIGGLTAGGLTLDRWFIFGENDGEKPHKIYNIFIHIFFIPDDTRDKYGVIYQRFLTFTV